MAIVSRPRKDGTLGHQVQWPDPVTGKKRVHGTFDTLRDARAKEALVRLQARTGELPGAPVKVNVATVIDEWHKTRRGDEETVKHDEWAVRRLRDAYGDRPVRSITDNDCQSLVAAAREVGLKPKTINHMIKAMRSVFVLAVDRDYAPRSPARNVKTLPERGIATERIRVLTPGELRRLSDAMEPYWQPLMKIWPRVGLRIGEVFGLRWENVDLAAGKLHVRQQAPRRATESSRPLKTDAACRTIPLTPSTMAVLRGWKLACPPSSLGLVFPAKNGSVQNPNNFRNRQWKDAKTAAGLPDVTPHDMRHTFVSYLISAGADIKYIQMVAGHQHAKVTMDTYGHLLGDLRPDVLAKAEQLYGSIEAAPVDAAQVSGL